MNLDVLVDKYKRYKNIIEQIENGDWKHDEQIANMSIKHVMNLRYIITELEKLGIHTVKPQRVD